VYALAFLAQVLGNFAWVLTRDSLLHRNPLGELLRLYIGANKVDAILSMIAFMVALVAVKQPFALIVIGPLVWMLDTFSRERTGRYTATLELHRAYRGTVMLMADVLESEDGYTADHSKSVVELVQAVATEMEVDRDSLQELEFAALLHDVGKITIPKEILNKPSRLSDEEFDIMKTHTIEGQFMLDRVGGLLGRVGEIVRSCHERWDGNGYPDGLKGEEVPLAARIVFVCDAYNAMTTNRPYRSAMPSHEALQELVDNAGTQFDPRVVAALSQVIQKGEPELTPTDGVRAVLAGAQASHELSVAS
jgi:putative nucleotidyltransferase with HDIG domain